MFNVMLTHGINPKYFLAFYYYFNSKGQLASINFNYIYGGIPLFNSICKLHDYVFIELNIDNLKTDDMQFWIKN